MLNTVFKYVISGAVVCCLSATTTKYDGGEKTEYSIKELAEDAKINSLTASANSINSTNSSFSGTVLPEGIVAMSSADFFQTAGTELRNTDLFYINDIFGNDSVNFSAINTDIYENYFVVDYSFDLTDSEYLRSFEVQISKYDDLIQAYADGIGWDWRLLAAMIYHESRFNPSAISHAGANGLMQIMPRTAENLGVEDSYDPDESIKGGTRYLKIVWDRFDEVENNTQRIKFCLAAYNAGYSHVVDAQRLAREYGLKSNVWDDNVENMILNLSHPEYYNNPLVRYGYVRGKETYNYVEKVFHQYDHYLQLSAKMQLAQLN